MRQCAIAHCDPYCSILHFDMREKETETVIATVLAQVGSAHASATDAVAAVKRFTVVGQELCDLDLMSTALSSSLGLPVTVSHRTRFWYSYGTRRLNTLRLENKSRVSVFYNLQPFVLDTRMEYDDNITSLKEEQGFGITCELPRRS